MRAPANACVIMMACLAAPVHAEPAGAPGARMPAKRARPVETLRTACARAFDDGRYGDAATACHEAEALERSPKHLLIEAQALRRLGRAGEARVLLERLVGTKLAPGAPADAQLAQEAARRELAAIDLSGVRIVSILQKPSPIDVSRLTNPGLPADPAAPRILTCARNIPGGLPAPTGVLRIALRVAASGAVEGVDVRAEAAEPGRLAPSPALVACVQAELGALHVERVPGAGPTALAGKFYVRSEEGPLPKVFGRLREVSR